MENTFFTYLSSPVGWLKLTGNSNSLLSVSFEEMEGDGSSELPPILKKSRRQLEEYFEGIRKEFDLKLSPEGTDFQQKIWKLVTNVSYGKTATYHDISVQSGSEKSTRAVGLANGKNPIPIIIPCHRIIGSNGKLTGYAGGLERKRWLLLHEQQNSPKQDMLF
ncbi:methylated-DNA--[protein]-cysteine S-methyltransferase [Maribellus mangrovi]|uniref:methylated-DNA--[protein]-cysteine S-methyltransferase n=1 Tax=Maribellus mangrovi TaxID=3133146 RepID=UPI0030EEBBFD